MRHAQERVRPRRHAVQGALALGIAALCLGAAARAATTPMPEGLDVQALALAPADFDGGARIASQGFFSQPPALASYERKFRPGAYLAGKHILFALNEVDVYADDHVAAAGFESLRAALSTSSGRRALAREILAGTNVKNVSATVGRPVSLRLGQGAFRLSITTRARTSLGRIRIDIAITGLRIDRGLGLIALVGYPNARLTSAPAVLATTRLARRFRTGFTIRSLAPPTVAGIPQQGQTLTAAPGRWAGAPSLFTYQWNRCDAAGANCAAIAGATGQTYLLGAQDSAKRVSVTVKAANSVSSASMTSSATALVP